MEAVAMARMSWHQLIPTTKKLKRVRLILANRQGRHYFKILTAISNHQLSGLGSNECLLSRLQRIKLRDMLRSRLIASMLTNSQLIRP